MIETIHASINEFIKQLDMAPSWEELTGHILLLVLLLLFSILIGTICRKMMAPLILKMVKRTETLWDDYFFNDSMVRAICHIVPGLVFYILVPYCLPYNHELLSQIVLQGSKIYITVTFLSLILVFLNNTKTFTREEEKFKDKHLYGILEFLKIMVYFIGSIVIIAFLLGENPLSMVAGIGAAATVLMLIFKDSILGLVAGIQLSVNHMVKPGDWITIKKLDIDGVVVEVSLTTVKVRNFDNTISTVPPYSLISDSFQNWAPMLTSSGRRVKRALFIDMNSIGFCQAELLEQLHQEKLITEEEYNQAKMVKTVNLTLFRSYAERYMRSLAHVNTNDLVFSRQLAPTPNGLPLEFWYFSKITAFTQYESLAAASIEHFIAILPTFGLKLFQSPTGQDLQRLKNQLS